MFDSGRTKEDHFIAVGRLFVTEIRENMAGCRPTARQKAAEEMYLIEMMTGRAGSCANLDMK